MTGEPRGFLPISRIAGYSSVATVYPVEWTAHRSPRLTPVEWRCGHPSFAQGDEVHEDNHQVERVLAYDGDRCVCDVQRRHCRACASAGDDQRHDATWLPRVFRDDPRLLEAARL